MYNEKEPKHYGLTIPSGSLLSLNPSFILSWTGILTVLQIIGSSVCLGVLLIHCQPSYNGLHGSFIGTGKETFFLLSNFSVLVSVLLIFLSSLISIPTASVLNRTLIGIIFNSGFFLLTLAATFFFFLSINVENGPVYQEYDHNWKLALSIISSINAVIHGINGMLCYQSCRRSWS